MSEAMWIALTSVIAAVTGSGGLFTMIIHQRGQNKVNKELQANATTVQAAVTPNGGQSIKDAVDRIETRLNKLDDRVTKMDERMQINGNRLSTIEGRLSEKRGGR